MAQFKQWDLKIQFIGREHFYKSSGFLPAFRPNVFFGVSGFQFIICKQAHVYQKFHFLTAVLTYKVISAFVVIGSFQFDKSSELGGSAQIVQGPLQALPLSPAP